MSISEPWVRVLATKRAKPELASQAEKVNKIMGARVQVGVAIDVDQREMAINRDSIMLSRQMRADRRWERFRARPMRPRIKAEEKVK